jgi:sulfonate transport system permease protein
MSISHAPPGSPAPDIPETSPQGAVEPTSPAPAPDLEPIVPTSSRRTRVPRWLRRTTGPVLLLALWQLLSSTGVLTADVLASPDRIAQVAGDLVADGSLTSAMTTSLQRVAGGLLLGTLIGTGLALVSGLFRVGEDVVDAPVQMLRCSSSGSASVRPRRSPSSHSG